MIRARELLAKDPTLIGEGTMRSSEVRYKHRVVAFMDILGWSDTVAHSVRDRKLRERMENAVRALHSIVIHDAADVSEWEHPAPDDQVGLFSDSIIISYPLRHKHDITRMIRQVCHYQTFMLMSADSGWRRDTHRALHELMQGPRKDRGSS